MLDKNMLPFWKIKTPHEMTQNEWESLCDGCAKCCLHKLEYEDSGQLSYTRIVCRYYDETKSSCTCYDDRTILVPTCLKLTPDNILKIHFMPRTCAYRLLAEGKDFEWWHPLVSGDPDTVHTAGISICGKVLCEEYVHPDGWEEHIITWAD